VPVAPRCGRLLQRLVGRRIALSRTRSSSRRSTAQETCGAEILIEVRPVNAETTARQLPVGALSRSGVDQTRKPDERDGKRSTVGKVDSEQVFVDSNIDDTLTRSCFRSGHSRPLAVRRSRRVARGGCEPALARRSRDFARVPADPTRTWRCSCRDQRERAVACSARDCRSRCGRDRFSKR